MAVSKELIINTVLYANSLRDNLDILVDNGWLLRDMKMLANRFSAKLGRFTETIYQNTETDGVKAIAELIDIDMELLSLVHKMSIDEKVNLLQKLKNENTKEKIRLTPTKY